MLKELQPVCSFKEETVHIQAFYPDFGPGLKVLILLVDHQQHLSDVTSLTCSVLPVASLTWQEAVGPQQQKVVIIHECV